MFVYIAKFSKYPDFIKIGKSIDVTSRVAHLTKSHGDISSLDVYAVGTEYHQVETALLNKFKPRCVKRQVSGDGNSEFFSNSVYEEATDILTKYRDAVADRLDFNRAEVEKSLRLESIRCKNLISKLLGCRVYGKMVDDNPMFAGFWELHSLQLCVDMGFTEDEVIAKFLESKKTPNYTTQGRIKLAYSLHDGHNVLSPKIASLKKQLSDNPVINIC